MKKFRLPRKIKKIISKGFYLYPSRSDGSRVWAQPTNNQKDYDALKSGLLENLAEKYNKS